MRRDNLADLQQEIRDLMRRVRDLETRSVLSNAAISEGAITIIVPGEPGPEGPDGQPGQPGPSGEAGKIGAAGGKIGFLVPGDGPGEWLTTEEYTSIEVGKETVARETQIGHVQGDLDVAEGKISVAEGKISVAEGKISAAETEIVNVKGRMTSAEAGINYSANRLDNLESFANTYGPTVNSHGTKISGLEGRMTSAEGGITYTANRTTDLEGRMGNAESSLNGKASVSSVTTAQNRADSAWNLANGRATKSKQDELIDAHNKLTQHVFANTGGTPPPPVAKG